MVGYRDLDPSGRVPEKKARESKTLSNPEIRQMPLERRRRGPENIWVRCVCMFSYMFSVLYTNEIIHLKYVPILQFTFLQVPDT